MLAGRPNEEHETRARMLLERVGLMEGRLAQS
jgi:hypothetical protein